jgi:hypothetical protein
MRDLARDIDCVGGGRASGGQYSMGTRALGMYIRFERAASRIVKGVISMQQITCKLTKIIGHRARWLDQ